LIIKIPELTKGHPEFISGSNSFRDLGYKNEDAETSSA